MANFYAEGVDLKVAEKYRVPPRITVDREVLVHVSGDHYKQLTADPETEYNFNLERNVIQKIEEWKRVHDQTEHDRQEQLRARDRERRQLIEQQQKQLLNLVSYPSTDDLSSDGEEAKTRQGPEEADESSGVAPPPTTAVSVRDGSEVTATNAHRMQSDFSVILQPTVVPESKSSGPSGGSGCTGIKPSSLTAALNGGSSSTNVFSNSSKGHSRNHSDLNYSEWESDNYSPFDRMELKSINDLDILAQVLETTQLNRNAALSLSSPPALDNNKDAPPPSSPVEEQLPKTAVEDEQKDTVEVEGESTAVSHSWNTASSSSSSSAVVPQVSNGSVDIVTTFPNYQMLPPHQHPQDYGQQQHLQHSVPASGGYYNNNNNQHHQQQQQQQQQLQHPPHQYHSNTPTFTHNNNQFTPMQQYSANNYHQSYTTSDQHHQQIISQQHPAAFNGHHHYAEREEQKSNSLLKSRSKSVPDIVNELEEEVKASEQRRRVRNHSQSCKAPEEEEKEEDDGVAEEGTASPAPLQAYERLPPDSRTLALKISKMGFSVNVVATVIEQLGNDDKKIIEHLIPLSELLDLGFGISPTSEALLKFNNNRERALDFLIS